MNILQTTDLKKYYGTEPNITKALDGVTLSIEEGEFVAIVGTSGSGKSTLLNMMGGLDTPTSGSIKVKGKELSKLKDEQLTIFRRRNIGFIFQNYNLVPVLNVYENIVLPVELDGDTAKNPEAFEAIIRCMKESGIGYGSVNHPVDRDPVCGFTGVIDDVCPRCGRHEGEAVSIERLNELRKKYPDIPVYFDPNH